MLDGRHPAKDSNFKPDAPQNLRLAWPFPRNRRTGCLCNAYIVLMRRFAGIVALLLLFSGAAPVLACMTTGTLNSQESACCRSMHHECGDMAKLGCCRTEIRIDGHPQLPGASPSFDLHWVVVNWLPPSAIAPEVVTASFLSAPREHSPPGLLATKITVLRI